LLWRLGAKGGGKSHIVRIKGIGGALFNPGINILMMRKTYNELEENLIRPILKELSPELYSYNGSSHLMTSRTGAASSLGTGRETKASMNITVCNMTGYS
jgi:phage terminase large subunit